MTLAGEHHRAWRELPVGGLDEVIGAGRCLVLAPHPDDESLGCGGLIAASVRAGRPPLVVVLTDGSKSHPGSLAWPAERLKATRAEEVRRAVGCLGLAAERLVLLDEPDGAAPSSGARFDAVVERVQSLARAEPACGTILAPWPGDPHCDHEAAARIAVATRLRVVFYPVWGWMLPADAVVPLPVGRGWRLDVAPYRAVKQRAIDCHASQHGQVVTDDPGGFTLPEELLAVFDSGYETYLRP